MIDFATMRYTFVLYAVTCGKCVVAVVDNMHAGMLPGKGGTKQRVATAQQAECVVVFVYQPIQIIWKNNYVFTGASLFETPTPLLLFLFSGHTVFRTHVASGLALFYIMAAIDAEIRRRNPNNAGLSI
jgi:hypothetical protein